MLTPFAWLLMAASIVSEVALYTGHSEAVFHYPHSFNLINMLRHTHTPLPCAILQARGKLK